MQLKDPNSLSFESNLDLTKIRQLQQQDAHISEIITKCKICDKTPYYMDKYGIVYREIKDRSDKVHAVMLIEYHTFTPFRSLSTIEVSSLCSHLSNLKTTEFLDLHLHKKT